MTRSLRISLASAALALVSFGLAILTPATTYKLRYFPEYDLAIQLGALLLAYVVTALLLSGIQPPRRR